MCQNFPIPCDPRQWKSFSTVWTKTSGKRAEPDCVLLRLLHRDPQSTSPTGRPTERIHSPVVRPGTYWSLERIERPTVFTIIIRHGLNREIHYSF